VRGCRRRLARASATVLALLVTAAACGDQSRVAPDATITISGVVLGPDGDPVVQRPVRLGTGITDGEGVLAVLTVGLSCTGGACTGDVRDAATDDAGRFAFTLEGRDTQSSFGEAVSVLVSATGSPAPDEVSGPLSSARFRVQTEALELPALHFVDPDLTVDGTTQVVTRWEPTSPGPYDLTFDDGHEVPVWRIRTAEPTATVDPRLLEDTAGRVVVGGAHEDAIEGSDVELRWRSPGVGYAAGAGAPPSRGRTCRYVDLAGTASGESDSCELTDGDLASQATTPSCRPDAPMCELAAAIIDLGSPVPAELVAVRGCDGGCSVEVSADGTSFRPVGAVPEEFGVVALDGAPVSRVKVGLGAEPSGLREVSVWGPAPATALVSLDSAGREALAQPYADGSDDQRPSLLLAGLAAAAAGAVLVGLGVALGRRRAAVST